MKLIFFIRTKYFAKKTHRLLGKVTKELKRLIMQNVTNKNSNRSWANSNEQKAKNL